MSFASMHIFESYGFNGITIATSLSTAEKLINLASPQKRLFYVWDLEWIRPWVNKSFSELQSVYGNKGLELIARSDDHADVISKCWNREKPLVIPDFNIEDIMEVYNGKKE